MSTFKWLVGLFCFFYPTRLEGGFAESAHGEIIVKAMVHADQVACGTVQDLIHEHAT
jgi:hypothetical protein